MDYEKENRDACLKYQAFYDENLCQHVGTRAPAPVEGQDVNEYRADCCRTFKRTYLTPDQDLYKVDYRRLVSEGHLDVFNNFERQLIPACREGAFNPLTVPKGDIRAIPKRDGFTGTISEIVHIGQDSFVKFMGRPGRRVQAFRTPTDHSGNKVGWLNVP